MNERRDEPHPLELEQWLLSEQAPAARVQTETRLAPSEQAQLRGEDAALRAQLFEAVPPAALLRRVLSSVETTPRTEKRSATLSYLLSTAVLAAALLLIVRPPPSRDAKQRANTGAFSERAKGAQLALHVYRQHGSLVERVAAGGEVSSHEILQLGYARGGFSHGVLLSIDGRGHVTLHFPSEPGESTALTNNGEQVLSEAYELDDAPTFERFVFVAARQALSVEQVLGAARSLAASPGRVQSAALLLDVPHEQRSLLLRKTASR